MKNDVENEGYIIIPARDEEKNLGYVLSGILEYTPIHSSHIILVNNRSIDKTEEIAKSFGVSVINESNIGYGNACLAGINSISKSPKWILIMDADGSDDPKDIQRLYQHFQITNADLVIGSRTLGSAEKGSLSFIQKFGNVLTCFLLFIFYQRKFTDLGPLRIIRYEAYLKMKLEDKTWGWNIEMQIRALQENLKISEIPVNYLKRKHGVSKISGNLTMAIRVGIKILYTFFKLTLFPPKK